MSKVLSHYECSALDKAFITELAFGCIRYRKLLDLWIDHTSKLTYDKQPPKLRWLLHIGLYQLIKMDRIPSAAAISTTVEISKRSEISGLSGVVNGILRNAAKKIAMNDLPEIPVNDVDNISYKESIPAWLVKEMIHWVGLDQAKIIAKSFNQKPSIDIRLNTLKTNISKSLFAFKQSGFDVKEIKGFANAFQLMSKPRSIQDLPGYKEGEWVIQDRSSQWIAPLLNSSVGDKILDACSAPGSKTTHIAQLIQDQGEIWAVDKSEIRLKILQSNLDRLKIKSVKTLRADTLDLISLRPEFTKYFDRILLDAPCSGIGTFSRNPDARWSLSQNKIKELINLQEKLLTSIIPLLKKNGRLVYSTCTICPGENNILIKKFLERNTNMKLVFEKQILPGSSAGGDGFYSAIIIFKD